MKNKGFTLIELLGVIIILALLMIIVFPSIINSVKNSSDKTDELTKELIYNAADLFIDRHMNEFPKTVENKYVIDLKSLIDEGLITGPIKLSDSDTDVTNKKCIQVTYNKGYKYELKDSGSCEEIVKYIVPSKYQKVEYIESDGTQYINTGLIGKTGYTLETNVSFTSLATGSYQYFAGYAYTGSADRMYYIRLANTTKHLGYTYGPENSTTAKLSLLEENVFYNIKSIMKEDKQELIVDRVRVGSSSYGALEYDENNPKYIYMFMSQYVNGTNGGTKAKCKEAKWYDENDVLIRDFIPCYRKSDGEIGMYDLITGKFYTNSGTGTFEKGKDI